MLKCSRYVFSYQTPPDEVEDFILRSDDLAAQTYGRDKFFSRLNQVLDQARFLGWPLPRFGINLPDDLTEIPPQGIDHIFENQAKLLVDVAPVTRVVLENGKYCPVRMVCGSTAAGDLVWKCHLMADQEGNPYVQRSNLRLRVKTKGTKIVCQTQSLPYDEKYIFECFGGEEGGIYPVPFLPEFFIDRPIAQKFSPEMGVVEVIKIQEDIPVSVFAKDLVPWYRPLEIDRTRALSFDPNEAFDHPISEMPQLAAFPQEQSARPGPQTRLPANDKFNPESLIQGWDDFDDEDKFDLDSDWDEDFGNEEDEDEDDLDSHEDENQSVSLLNLVCTLDPNEESFLHKYDEKLSSLSIASKAEAEDLRKDPEHKERAEEWLLNLVNRLSLLANHSSKIGALISIIEKNRGNQTLVIQPRQKWASNLVEVLRGRGIEAAFYNPQNKAQTSKFYEGTLNVLVATEAKEELLIEDLTVISTTTFKMIDWLDLLNPSQLIYTLPTKQLGFSDLNFVPEHPALSVDVQEYNGPSMDIMNLGSSESNKNTSTNGGKTPSKKKEPTPKYKIKGQKGRPKTATSYEKALEIAKKLEEKEQKVEIIAPDGKEVLYTTGMPVELQGDLN